MAVHTLQAPMPSLRLIPGMLVKLEAISPTTGGAITGVTASAWSIYARDVSDDVSDLDQVPAGPFMLVPGPDASGP